MNDNDIRTAFENLDRDVRSSVQTEFRLEQITAGERTRPRRPAFAMVVAAAAVIVVVGGAVLVLRPGVTTTTVPPATTGPTTTLADASTTTTAPDTTLTPGMPVVEPGMVLVADLSVDVLEIGDGHIGYMAERVVADGTGGIVVQIDGRLIQIEQSGESRDLVDGRVLATSLPSPVTIRLEDTAVIAGSPRIIYTVTTGSGFEVVEEVWSFNLTAGTADLLLRQDDEGSFEDTITRVSVADGIMVVTLAAPGTTYFEYYDNAGQPLSITGPVLGANPRFTDFDKPVPEGVVSPDGATLAYLQHRDITTGEDGYYIVDVIVWDLGKGEELDRIELELRDGESLATPGRMDYDGVGIVLGRTRNGADGSIPLPPLRIESLAKGGITEIPVAGSPSLVK